MYMSLVKIYFTTVFLVYFVLMAMIALANKCIDLEYSFLV